MSVHLTLKSQQKQYEMVPEYSNCSLIIQAKKF